MSDYVLNSNQVEMLTTLYDAKSSPEHPVNLNSLYGFRTHREDVVTVTNSYDDEALKGIYARNTNKLHADYLKISTHSGGLGYIDHKGDLGWITEAGKKFVEEMRVKIKSKIKSK